jgi:hypothetical protein
MKLERESYKVIREKYTKIGKGNVRLTQSSLIFAQAISANTKTYAFPVLDTDNASTTRPYEIRLNMNDEFISYEVGYYVVSQNRDAEDVPLGFGFWTYAPYELALTAASLVGAWDARMSIDINNIKRLENWDMKKHNFVPRTQLKNSFAASLFATIPSIDFSKDGCETMQPMITLSGAKKNNIVITLANSIVGSVSLQQTLPDTNAIFYDFKELCLLFRGMLAQNAAKFQN